MYQVYGNYLFSTCHKASHIYGKKYLCQIQNQRKKKSKTNTKNKTRQITEKKLAYVDGSDNPHFKTLKFLYLNFKCDKILFLNI